MYSQVAPPGSNSSAENGGGDFPENLSEQEKETVTDEHLSEKPPNVSADKWLV